MRRITSSRNSSAVAFSLNRTGLFGAPASFIADSRACRYGAASAAKLLAAGVFPHLCPQKEMSRRRLDHIKAIEHLIAIYQANMLLGFLEDRAAAFSSP